MKDSQIFKTDSKNTDYFLQETLNEIYRAGEAIQHVSHCLNEMQRKGPVDKNADFSYLDLVATPALEDAILLLGGVVKDKSNELCEQFGLLLWG